jgi:hypothetical protein
VPKASVGAEYHVFFSHSHKDRWIAKQCVKSIEERGKGRIRVFLDEMDIQVGESIPESVRANIEQCQELVVLLSEVSKDRPWVLIEVGAAWGLRKAIMVVLDKIGPNEMPDIIRHHRAIDLNDFDQYLDQLASRAGVGQ